MKIKITEIKICAGKDVILMTPDDTACVFGGKVKNLPEKLAKKLFKEVSRTAELMWGEIKDGEF